MLVDGRFSKQQSGRIMLDLGAGPIWETYSLNDLEEDYTKEAVNLSTFVVRASHLGLHSLSESARGLECAGNDENARKEKPEVSMVGRKGV